MTTEKYIFPLSFAQERLWFLEQFEPDSSLYIMEDMGVHIKGMLDIKILKDCLQKIVNRHETLRTNFDSIEGRPVQIVDETREIDLDIIDLSEAKSDDVFAHAQQIAVEIIRKPLNLKDDALFKAFLIELDKDEFILFFAMHHIISDGLSINILLKELGSLYSGEVTGQNIELPDLPI